MINKSKKSMKDYHYIYAIATSGKLAVASD